MRQFLHFNPFSIQVLSKTKTEEKKWKNRFSLIPLFTRIFLFILMSFVESSWRIDVRGKADRFEFIDEKQAES